MDSLFHVLTNRIGQGILWAVQSDYGPGRTREKLTKGYTVKTVINGCTVEYEGENDEGVTQCFISKGRFSASLAALEGTGCLTDSGSPACDELPIDEPTIDAISAWATAQGY
jgi:hypothetical protein